ncbi:MAG: hypothetical protein KGS61_19280, partial [Verrucomicrobia bacterium]|nr:hypothetical protein [Verrucomicrobiota bacterium]
WGRGQAFMSEGFSDVWVQDGVFLGGGTGGVVTVGGNPRDPSVQAMARRHDGLWTMTFCDGHVDGLKVSQLFATQNPAVAQRWNWDNQAP